MNNTNTFQPPHNPPHCPLCVWPRTRRVLTQNGYQVFRCGLCSFVFVAPTPTPQELARYYDQSYAVPLERYARNMAHHERRIIDLERWQPRRGRLLEVGCSYGHTLAIARTRGWQVAGVEMSPTAACYAREHFGLAVFTGDLLDAPCAEHSFDAVIMWHVLEHTHDPQAQLERLRTLLRPGGVLGLRVPNVTSFGARVAGRAWPWMCPPAHLWFFSPTTLPRLLAQCGFEVLEISTQRGDGNNPYQHLLMALGGWLNALRQRGLPRQTPTRTVARDSSAPGSASPLRQTWGRVLTRAQPITDTLAQGSRPLIAPLEAAGWGDELVCYARRTLDEPVS